MENSEILLGTSQGQTNPQAASALRRYYPSYHLAPVAGWMNDPNGLIYYKGLYHAFYQHYPHDAVWGTMHWGHAISPDLVHWQHHAPALAPSIEADKGGCYSGSAVVDGGKLYLIYTGNAWLSDEADTDKREFRQVQCLAVSDDGFNFVKHGEIIAPPAGIMHFRDPKVWFEDGFWWMVCGVSTPDNQAQVWLYRGASLTDWEFDRILSKSDGSMGYMWECPDFFPLGGEETDGRIADIKAAKRILSFSPQGLHKHKGYAHRNLFDSGYITGSWRPGSDFTAETPFVELDYGHDYYASQSLLAADGRRIVLAWLDMWKAPQPSSAEGWAGSMTLPRSLSLGADGHVLIKPLAELESLRAAEESIAPRGLDNSEIKLADNVTAREFKLEWNRKTAMAERYGIRLGDGCAIYMDTQSGRLTLSRYYPALHLSGYRSVELKPNDSLALHIFFDNSSVEVFANNGEAVMSSRIYPDAGNRAVMAFADSGFARLDKGAMWKLGNCLSAAQS